VAVEGCDDDAVGPRHGVALQHGPDKGPPCPRHGVGLHPAVSQQPQFGKPVSGSVSVIINQYKSSVKRWCNKNGYGFFQWQPRFYDHIIRNDESRNKIAEYIVNNAKQWGNSKLNLNDDLSKDE
jgi:hypothetical protein